MAGDAGSAAARIAARTIGLTAIAGAGVLAYSLIEARSYRLRSAIAPVLNPGQAPVLVLHLSDLHMTPRQRGKKEWISELAALQPDLVVATGDFFSHPDAPGTIVTALAPLLDVPGAFVFGSNDYYSPKIGNPAKYLQGPSNRKTEQLPDLPFEDLASTFESCGWANLNNRTQMIKAGGLTIDARGTDDPHIARDDYSKVAGPFDPTVDLGLAVTHAPYHRVIDAMADDGADLIMAGHTHGGQICIPGYGALVTNCDLDTARVKGLHRHRDSWMHVSAGLGTNPYTPVRFACPPEATLLTLVPRSE